MWNGEGRECGCRELRREALELRTGRGEDQSKVGVVPDQHDRGHRLRHGANALEERVGGGGVQLRLHFDRRTSERGPHQVERLPGANGRGAEDELRPDSEPDKMRSDPLPVPAASLG